MTFNESIISYDEKVIFGLRALYRRYGYTQYRMSRFEEYDLYVSNKDFLKSDSVITFTDGRGKLLALKPDVTFSIIKNATDAPGDVQKVCYDENVYRAPLGTRDFKEIMQTGLECTGDIDLYCICEVLTLAAESLRIISDSYVLDISHLGFTEGLFDELDITPRQREEVLKCIGDKNVPGIKAVLGDRGESLSTLTKTYGRADEVIGELRKISVNAKTDAALSELECIVSTFAARGMCENVHLDFSVINSMSYYNGIVFQGFAKGIPNSVLSGGQYDRLMHKMGRESGAIGFAVYLDNLRDIGLPDAEYDTDVLVLYDSSADMALLNKIVDSVVAGGESVLVRKTEKGVKYRRLVNIGNGVNIYD